MFLIKRNLKGLMSETIRQSSDNLCNFNKLENMILSKIFSGPKVERNVTRRVTPKMLSA